MTRTPFIIAVDGPAGVGKGTLSKALAAHYNLALLETGLLYRALAFKVITNNIDAQNEDEVANLAHTMTARDTVNPILRQDHVANMASKIGTYPKVRAALFDFQRTFASTPPVGTNGTILDGRDVGTCVLPEAPFKFFLDADIEIRAKRRYEELLLRGNEAIYANVLEDMRVRDRQDREREISPLKAASDAVLIDTSHLSIGDVFEKACAHIDRAPDPKG